MPKDNKYFYVEILAFTPKDQYAEVDVELSSPLLKLFGLAAQVTDPKSLSRALYSRTPPLIFKEKFYYEKLVWDARSVSEVVPAVEMDSPEIKTYRLELPYLKMDGLRILQESTFLQGEHEDHPPDIREVRIFEGGQMRHKFVNGEELVYRPLL